MKRMRVLTSVLFTLLLFAAFAAGPAALTGCGGGGDTGKKSGKKKGKGKKKKKKKDEPKKDTPSGPDLEINEIVFTLKEDANYILKGDGTYQDIWNLKKKLDEGEAKIKKLGGDKTGEFEKIRGLIKEKVLSDPLMKKAISDANKKPEDYDGAIKLFEETIAYFDGVEGPETKKAVARLQQEIKTVKDLKVWVQRTPSGKLDLLANGMKGWEKWGSLADKLEVSFSGGEMTLKMGDGKNYANLTAKHCFWKGYTAQIDFTLESGEIIVIHRHIPGKSGAPFQSALGEGWEGEKKELTFEVLGESMKVLAPDGSQIDHLTGNVPGGGITFKVRPGTVVTIHTCMVTPE